MNKGPTMEVQHVTVVATRLKLRNFLQLVRFFRVNRKVERQLRATPGLIGCWLRADFLRLHFSTLSVWKDDSAIDAFVRTGFHRDAMAVFDRISIRDASSFVRWKTDDPQEATWEEAAKRLLGTLG